jgi:hypothetical protein
MWGNTALSTRVPTRTQAWSATTATRPKRFSLPNSGIARAM